MSNGQGTQARRRAGRFTQAGVAAASRQITAIVERSAGSRVSVLLPLVWIDQFKAEYSRPYWFVLWLGEPAVRRCRTGTALCHASA